MIRAFIFLLMTLIAIVVIRSVIGIIAKALSSGSEPVARRPADDMPTTGELKRDPVCGTYVSTALSVKRVVGHETLHFCSETCRDRYQTQS
jgi:YHS domain-containing protein